MFDDKQKYLRDLISNIKRLTSKEKYHILSIFKKYNIECTKNSNGYFFNLDKVDYTILDKICKCVNLIEEKRDLITSLDKKRESHLIYYKNLIENKLKETIFKKREEYISQLIITPSKQYIKKKYSNIVKVHNINPDVLMKSHNSKIKYHKDSEYSRLTKRIYNLAKESSKSKNLNRDENNGGEDEDGGDGDGDGYGDGYGDGDGDGDRDCKSINDSKSADESENNTSKLKDSDDKSLEEEEEEEEEEGDSLYLDYDNETGNVTNDEYYNDTNSCTDINEVTHGKRKIIRIDKYKKDISPITCQEINYYKSLLRKSGFEFDDDKCVKMKQEIYIE